MLINHPPLFLWNRRNLLRREAPLFIGANWFCFVFLLLGKGCLFIVKHFFQNLSIQNLLLSLHTHSRRVSPMPLWINQPWSDELCLGCVLCFVFCLRLQCYKSSKEQTPLLDVSLLGCTVIYKEKQPKRKEHKLKIIPLGGEAIVLGLQSKEQTEQWLKVLLISDQDTLVTYMFKRKLDSHWVQGYDRLRWKSLSLYFGAVLRLCNVDKDMVHSCGWMEAIFFCFVLNQK